MGGGVSLVYCSMVKMGNNNKKKKKKKRRKRDRGGSNYIILPRISSVK